MQPQPQRSRWLARRRGRETTLPTLERPWLERCLERTEEWRAQKAHRVLQVSGGIAATLDLGGAQGGLAWMVHLASRDFLACKATWGLRAQKARRDRLDHQRGHPRS